MESRFRCIHDYPERQDANGVVMRLIDGLGYRFYWATQGLTQRDYGYSPGGGCQTIGELMGHVWELANWIHMHMLGSNDATPKPESPGDQREQTLELLLAIRNRVETIDENVLFAVQIQDFPFWHVINGPLSDALTHVGHIASFRRAIGSPVPEHHVFLCHPKEA